MKNMDSVSGQNALYSPEILNLDVTCYIVSMILHKFCKSGSKGYGSLVIVYRCTNVHGID